MMTCSCGLGSPPSAVAGSCSFSLSALNSDVLSVQSRTVQRCFVGKAMLESVLVAWRRATGFTIAALAMMCRDVHDLEFLVNLGNILKTGWSKYIEPMPFLNTRKYIISRYSPIVRHFSLSLARASLMLFAAAYFQKCFHNDAKRQRAQGRANCVC